MITSRSRSISAVGKVAFFYKVGYQFDGSGGISRRSVGVDERLFFGCVRVEFAADAFHSVGDVPGGAVASPLE